MSSLADGNMILSGRALARFCERNHIHKLSLFGSVLREDFRFDSDIDVLVEFDPEARIGLLRKAAIQNELSALLGRMVDLRTAAELSPYIRRRVVETAETRYVHR